ncbi:MAG: YciI family protein [Bacteroidota bacterium]|nr:YciI family protein [Bacteroidota bacterium]
MKDFLFLYRNDRNAMSTASPEEMQSMTQRWMDWIGSIAAQNKLTDRGNRLGGEGKVVRPDNVVTDGPYTEIKELLGGYSLVKVASLDEAVELAKGCPIFAVGGNVEVRPIDQM